MLPSEGSGVIRVGDILCQETTLCAFMDVGHEQVRFLGWRILLPGVS